MSEVNFFNRVFVQSQNVFGNMINQSKRNFLSTVNCKLYLFNMYRTVVPRFFNQFIFKTWSYRPAATGWFALTIFTVKLTFLFCKLMEKTGFSNSHVPDDDVLKYVRVIIRASRHGYTCQSGQRGRKLAYCICWIKHWHQNYII